MVILVGIGAAVAAALAALAVGIKRILRGTTTVGGAVIHTPTDDTRIDANGAVRSVQAAEIVVPREALDDIWDPMHLERLARTYWSFLSRCTLGMIRVHYTERERFVKLFGLIPLLTFAAPEYEITSDKGVVRWRIVKGLLANFYPQVARALSRFVYTNTQSRIHVIVTHGFLRRLVRRQLDESVTGRFSAPEFDEMPAEKDAVR
jgi:hypothetical protein